MGTASVGMERPFLVADGRGLGGSVFKYDGLQDCRRCFNSLRSTGNAPCADKRCLGDVFHERYSDAEVSRSVKPRDDL